MPTQATLTLVDAVSRETRQANRTLSDGALNAQAAFVRALVDEVERRHPADRLVASLREQLGDELARLAQLIGGPDVASDDAVTATRPIDVLVVDDDPQALRATATAVRSLGYPCRTARSAEEAVRESDREPAAIVLSDWCMPGMSGLELCVTLKRREPQAYVILTTAFHDNARLLDGVRGGADDFMYKPLDLDELEARLLGASRLLQGVRAVSGLSDRLRAAPSRTAEP